MICIIIYSDFRNLFLCKKVSEQFYKYSRVSRFAQEYTINVVEWPAGPLKTRGRRLACVVRPLCPGGPFRNVTCSLLLRFHLLCRYCFLNRQHRHLLFGTATNRVLLDSTPWSPDWTVKTPQLACIINFKMVLRKRFRLGTKCDKFCFFFSFVKPCLGWIYHLAFVHYDSQIPMPIFYIKCLLWNKPDMFGPHIREDFTSGPRGKQLLVSVRPCWKNKTLPYDARVKRKKTKKI